MSMNLPIVGGSLRVFVVQKTINIPSIMSTKSYSALCLRKSVKILQCFNDSQNLQNDSKSVFSVIPLGHYFFAQRFKRQVKEKPVDWLPFPWDWPPRFSVFESSGDLVKKNDVDLSLPKPGFELSNELKIATEDVKSVFSVATATIKERAEVERREILKKVQRHPLDFDSPEVKIALTTVRVRKLFELRAISKKNTHLKILLMNTIQRRNKLLKELYRVDFDRFSWLTEVLKVEYTPQPMGVKKERFTKKWDLRRLTREYCKNIKKQKYVTYCEELKSLQIQFLKEKERTLAWIDKEKKELIK